MKNECKKLIIFLLVTFMTFSLSFKSLAEKEGLLSLKSSRETYGDSVVTVSIDTVASEIVADGKLVINYDSEKMEYIETLVAGAWKNPEDVMVVANGSTQGKLIITFVGTEFANSGTIFNITFKVLKTGNAIVQVNGEQSSITGADNFRLDAKVQVDLNELDPNPGPIGPRPPHERPTPAPKPGKTPNEPEEPSKPIVKEEVNTGRFVDVNEGDYFKEAVDYVFENGYMNGISDYQFGPNLSTDRAMIVTILWRMSGKPQAKNMSAFNDVKANEYYAAAVAWAYENGIVKGLTESTFGPNVKLTREQLVTLFYRYAEFRGWSPMASGNLSMFSDAEKVNSYAVKGMIWAVEKGIVNGTSPTTIEPTGMATRGQLATIITRFANMYLK